MYVCVQRKRFYKVAIHSRVLVSSLLPFPPRPAAWLCARGRAPCTVTASTKCDLLKFHPLASARSAGAGLCCSGFSLGNKMKPSSRKEGKGIGLACVGWDVGVV